MSRADLVVDVWIACVVLLAALLIVDYLRASRRAAERPDPTLACEQYDHGETVQLDESVQLVYDVPRLLDQYEALRATLWRISYRAQRAAASGDQAALAEIETWADETLQETPWLDDPSPAE